MEGWQNLWAINMIKRGDCFVNLFDFRSEYYTILFLKKKLNRYTDSFEYYCIKINHLRKNNYEVKSRYTKGAMISFHVNASRNSFVNME